MRFTLETTDYQASAARDDVREEEQTRWERYAPHEPTVTPRFVFRIEGSMWVYTDTVTGVERSFHGAELSKAWAWKDAIVAKEQAEQKQEKAA